MRKPVQLAFTLLLLLMALPVQVQQGLCYFIATPSDAPIPMEAAWALTILSESGRTAVTIPHIPIVDLPEAEQILEYAEPPDTTVQMMQPVQTQIVLPKGYIPDMVREAVEQTIKSILETISNAVVNFVNWLGNAVMAFGTAIYNGVVGIVNVVYKGVVRTIETIVNTPGMILNMMWQTTAGSIVDFMDNLGMYGWAVSGLYYTVIVFETGLVGWAIIKVGAFLIKTLFTVLIP